jgi:predicted metal-dependent phosphoesterase TrpH
LHRKVCFSEEIKNYAESKGILLIPGVELEIHSIHVLLLNPPSLDVSLIRDFCDLKKFKEGTGALVIAPHPFFPGASCLNSKFFEHQDLFDAVEVNGVYLKWFDYNKNIQKLLKNHTFPIIGGSDTHFLNQFGLTYTLIEAEKNINAVLNAIRNNNVEVVTEPLSIKKNGIFTLGMFVCGTFLREALYLFKKCISAILGVNKIKNKK